MATEEQLHKVVLAEGYLVTRSELSAVLLKCSDGSPYTMRYAVTIYWRWIDPDKRWLAALSAEYIEDVFEWHQEFGGYVPVNLRHDDVRERLEAMLVFSRMFKSPGNTILRFGGRDWSWLRDYSKT